MKKLQKRIMRLYTAVCAAVLGVLGFTACSGQAVEYGTPHLDYRVKGKVVSSEGKPIKGIRVTVKDDDFMSDWPDGKNVVYTDEDGLMESGKNTAMEIYDQMVYFEDVDGVENGGEYALDSMALSDMSKKKVKDGSGSWYNGEYELSFERKLKKETGDEGEGEKD